MSSLVLGRAPENLSLIINPGASFSAVLESRNAAGSVVAWPVDATLRLVIKRTPGNGTFTKSWDWTIAGATARVTIPMVDVDDLPSGPLQAQLWLNYGDGEFLWCSGSVRRDA